MLQEDNPSRPLSVVTEYPEACVGETLGGGCTTFAGMTDPVLRIYSFIHFIHLCAYLYCGLIPEQGRTSTILC